MKQKILIRVAMTDDKTRAKAMKNAVQFKGVSAVEIKGDHRNQIEVTGVEVDMIALTNKIRKKVAFAELVSVAKVEPPKKPDADKKDGDKKEGDKKDGDKKPDEKKPDEKKPDEKKPEDKKPDPPKPCPCPPKPCPPNPEPCYPSYPPWPYGHGVPSAYPYPCNPHQYIGEPVYNHEPGCRIM